MTSATERNGQTPRRPRLPILLGGALLMWTAGWYGWGESPGLFWVTMVLTLVAWLLPWSLPSTLRSSVWSGLVAVLISLASNVARISPPEGMPATFLTLFDRITTTLFGFGVAALFFRPGRGTLLALAVGAFPMLGLVVMRDPAGGDGVSDAWVVWGGLLLLVLAQQSERLYAARTHDEPKRALSELLLRFALPLVALVLSVGVAPPLERGALVLRRQVFGLLMRAHRPTSQSRVSGGDLSLRSPPSDWGRRTRPLASIRAPSAPGYLREQVYIFYRDGKWIEPGDASEALPPMPSSPEGRAAFRIPPIRPAPETPDAGGVVSWEYHIQRPREIGGYCLPPQAVALTADVVDAPGISRDGCVAPAGDELLPARFEVQVMEAPRSGAYPAPAPPELKGYLAIPPELVSAASEWVAGCDGLPAATNTPAAVAAVVRHFNTHFRYQLGVLRSVSAADRLPAFMRLGRGHCTLFASAATLMLRRHGIPARMVGGFYSTELNIFDGSFVVRERDAHAWAEAWDPDRATWVRVEATPAAGLPDAMQKTSRVRQLGEWLLFRWRALIALVRQADLLGWPAEAVVSLVLFLQGWFQTPVGLGVAAALFALVTWRLGRRWRGRRSDPAQRLQHRLIRGMTRLEHAAVSSHLRRQPNEPWGEWARHLRAGHARRGDPASLEALVEAYQALRYAAAMDASAVQSWLREARAWPSTGRTKRPGS